MGEGGEGLIDRLLGGQRAVPLAIYCNLTSMGEKKINSLLICIFFIYICHQECSFLIPIFFLLKQLSSNSR